MTFRMFGAKPSSETAQFSGKWVPRELIRNVFILNAACVPSTEEKTKTFGVVVSSKAA